MFHLSFSALYGKLWHRTSRRNATIAEIRLERMRESWLRTLENLRHQASLRHQDHRGNPFLSGVSDFTSSAQLTGPLALDDQGNVNSVFVFQIKSTLVATSISMVAFLKGAAGGRAYWQVGSPATLYTEMPLADNDAALTSITLDTSSSVQFGRAAAQNGSGKLDSSEANFNCSGLPNGSSGTKRSGLSNKNQEQTKRWLAGVTVFQDIWNDGHADAAPTQEEIVIEYRQAAEYMTASVDSDGEHN